MRAAAVLLGPHALWRSLTEGAQIGSSRRLFRPQESRALRDNRMVRTCRLSPEVM
jgi:hypothetical protein